MAGHGVNLAVTKDGGSYNKLQRPGDFLASMSRPPPVEGLITATLPATHAGKRKRNQTASSNVHDLGQVHGSKRTRVNNSAPQPNAVRGLVDGNERSRGFGPTRDCGMRTTLPGLDDDEQLSDESMSEALAYLRSVRSEASTIPDLLVASAVDSTHDNSDRRTSLDAFGGQQALYRDGTWIAVDREFVASDDSEYDSDYHELDAQEECYKQLLGRFRALRNTYNEAHSQDPAQRKEAGFERSDAQPPQSRHWWLYTLDREYPTLAQVFQMDDRTLYRGLEYCTHALDRFDTISGQKSCWIWTLLALAGDVGTLDHWKISRIRELGQKAGRLSRKLHSGQRFKDRQNEAVAEKGKEVDVDESTEVPEDNEQDVQEKEDEHPTTDANGSEVEMPVSEDGTHVDTNVEANDLEKARARLLAQLGDRLVQTGLPSSEDRKVPSDSNLPVVDSNTRVTIDMILTVVAECYGQRDLLSFREVWL
ncbi:hypothetical protein P153DRAFT_364417 [Dothidotthia symphoricarpi CBS 119687]|uniref:Uncharacterized protein n=1 Tax=Dothidotthia symphoricarpi CBS 119687 TaxID=1392245 RepID=A0A6A6AL79_9PLEO|nr:uncharacterized protein P153DRAFT_364417 [Dothidotthia symphoricarpi CBS 119687]KAF2131953.1 hypothetical protein P153DRAFT_364417 [Dothidotthia symphoricarpi CBS 119687]